MSKQTQMDKKRSDHEEALHESEAKYRTLFDLLDEGFVISEPLFDDEGNPFDFLVLETNASFDRMMRSINAVGKRGLEIFPDAEASWFEAYRRVVETGESLHFEDYLAGLDRWFDLYISRMGVKGSRRLAIIFNDITDHKRQEANLALLAGVSQALADLTNIDETMAVLGERICKHFRAVLCAFSNIDETEQTLNITHEWKLPELPSWKGVYRVREIYTEDFLRTMHAGETYVVRDAQAHLHINAQSMAAIGIRSFVTVPLLRNGVWRYNLSIAHTAPRDWREDEIELMRELVTRIWARIERARAEEELRHSEERLRLIIESAKGYAIFTTDADGAINSWYAGAAQVFGWSDAEILGQKTAVTFTPEDRAAGEPQKELETARTKGIAPDIRWHLRKDGSRVFINGVVHLMRDGQRDSFLKIGRDMTAQRQAEEALRESQKQLQVLNETLEQKVQEKTAEVHRLASDLIKATQRERQRISRVLHDDLQQRIYAIQMQLSFVGDRLHVQDDTARRDISDIERELAEIVKMTRDLSIDLSPPILPGEGLSRAIEWLATRMREQYGLPIELQANGPFVISNEELHVLLFNCVRELLFNVVKHAGASWASVTLAWLDNGLQIEVRDGGKGFPDNMPEDEARKQENLPRSLGLPTLRHQLSLFGGSMEINSKPGAGTQVILIVPVAEA